MRIRTAILPGKVRTIDASVRIRRSTARTRESVRVRRDSRPIVIGFLGGYVRHDDAVHTTVQVAKSLRDAYPNAIHVATFENRRLDDAHTLIVNLLGAKSASHLTAEQKRSAHIILYGHSWGACAVVSLARQLKTEGIPVVLTVQVDSVSKAGRDDQTIPDNVRYAANFYQDKGFIRGQPKIVAADASRTTILGNFLFRLQRHPDRLPRISLVHALLHAQPHRNRMRPKGLAARRKSDSRTAADIGSRPHSGCGQIRQTRTLPHRTDSRRGRVTLLTQETMTNTVPNSTEHIAAERDLLRLLCSDPRQTGHPRRTLPPRRSRQIRRPTQRIVFEEIRALGPIDGKAPDRTVFRPASPIAASPTSISTNSSLPSSSANKTSRNSSKARSA